MSKWNDHQAVRPGSVHTTTFGDQADQGFHGSVMDELNAELEAEIVAVKGGKPMSYRDDTSRPLQDLYSGSPTRSSPKRTRAIGERSPGLSPREAPRKERKPLVVGHGSSATILQPSAEPIKGEYVERDGEAWYAIRGFDQMPPFFMSVVSDSNFWMFISSVGALTCGRVDANSSVFPYYTVDKIHDSAHLTGPLTVLRVTTRDDGKTFLWEPFVKHPPAYCVHRTIYKNMLGNRLEFEEVNDDLQLTFSYSWGFSEKFGLVRKCKVTNLRKSPVEINIVDGLQNIIPAKTNMWLQDFMANLVDAYKWNEIVGPGIGLFCLFAGMSDRAEAVESLFATTVWQSGLNDPKYLLSVNQIGNFKKGLKIDDEELIRGQRGAFLTNSEFVLQPESDHTWMTVCEVGQTHASIAELEITLARNMHKQLSELVDASMAEADANMKRIMGAADALQCTGDSLTVMHHYANVMFNVMRGGIFIDNYNVEKADLCAFIEKRNTLGSEEWSKWLSGFPDTIDYTLLIEKARAQEDGNLTRLCLEYVPVTFSRRHGDPSRPWNKFSIVLKDANGNKKLNYQGNWRDIFQNWEALCMSYPNFIDSMIAKFVNATTIDGYNPYVVNKDQGINWECPEPGAAFANLGYWGDHQIIYLLKFLELSNQFHPGRLEKYLNQEIFSYANVPYDYLPWEKIIEDSKNTISFNDEKNEKIEFLVKHMGTDGKLVLDATNKVYLVTLCEKLLVPILAKASNMVVDGGIWLNTQRPEWNDANNAIVGNGLSMVTLYYMRRYTQFMIRLFTPLGQQRMLVSEDVAQWMQRVLAVLKQNEEALGGTVGDKLRRQILDLLGESASAYRWKVYKNGFGGKVEVCAAQVVELMEVLQKYCEHSINANQTDTGLFHAYNILVLGHDDAKVEYLYEMLEGQVSVLSSNFVTGDRAVQVFEKLFRSTMYRRDQRTFMLYPDRQLKGFMDKNVVPVEQCKSSAVRAVLEKGHKSILYKDCKGVVRWASDLCNARDLKAAVAKIGSINNYLEDLLALYEATFNHRAFTGRSGTMFGFEGLGCIYWHMVSKLLLASQELLYTAVEAGQSDAQMNLCRIYYDVRGGIGFNKSPDVYGAFPCDPYSHTPKHAGAQQPGMTGQVKEEVITRWGELGLRVEQGRICFKPRLLRASEFLRVKGTFEYVTLQGEITKMDVLPQQLAFTYCQVPVLFKMGKGYHIQIQSITGNLSFDGNSLPEEVSADVFARRGVITKVEVEIPEDDLI